MKYHYAFYLLLAGLTAVSLSFTHEGTSFPETQKKFSQNKLEAIREHLLTCRQALSRTDREKALRSFHQARKSFKEAEYYLGYFHHDAVKDWLNGAPLPRLEENVNEHVVKTPTGFQRLEELVYADTVPWAEAQAIITSMLITVDDIAAYNGHLHIYDWQVLEALRFELIRISTLGITGFDCPASDSAIAESIIAFQALKEPCTHYAIQAGASCFHEMQRLMAKGASLLEGKSFDQFDRLSFIREVAEPLFALLLEIHNELGLETYAESSPVPRAFNYSSSSLFDPRVLNTSYFLKFNEAEITDARLELGQMLFFDPALSFNNALACASCHRPDHAFADKRPKSLSNDLVTAVNRNAPTLINALHTTAFFHDMRAERLEKQAEHVMVSEREFNLPPLQIAEKLRQSSEYRELFTRAFPGLEEPVQPHAIGMALSAYVASLVSWNSPFDLYVRGISDELDEAAKRGFNLFMGKAACGTCHFPPTFGGLLPPFYDDSESEVLGVTATNDTLMPVPDQDLGRFANKVRADAVDFHKHAFKTPTLRNAGLSAPYFHNGAYPTLEEVMWFYNKGGGEGLGLDIPNQTLPADRLGLTPQEIDDVIAFIHTLTDRGHFEGAPAHLPGFEGIPELQNRKPLTYP